MVDDFSVYFNILIHNNSINIPILGIRKRREGKNLPVAQLVSGKAWVQMQAV
jgi:hypothetical protein